uniref:GIY-YIG endonuclease n=1 Tax=Orbiocrella petchii TaxID=1105340 RepID=A0A6M8NWG8_9HYPO|nr:GIY-YIG endonuclease [Orbiocrella petchii]QKG05128.1 GIY-YIG endonuclease [Orbiocrella petchii]
MSNLSNIKKYKNILKNKGGIYSIIKHDGSQQYIGSAKDFYIRLSEHLNNTKSNKPLQQDIEILGIKKFYWVIYEYFEYQTRKESSKALLELETKYIKHYPAGALYNSRSVNKDK